jgi:hypothetical protein
LRLPEDPNAIGARGQGKFVFLRASDSYTMYYDTLRKDGIYRLGATQAQRTGAHSSGRGDAPWEGEVAVRQLKKDCGLDLFIGTRIIIVNPSVEFQNALENGEVIRAIQETWFRSLEKNQLTVEVCSRAGKQLATLPAPYPLSPKDRAEHKVWVLGKDFKDDEIPSRLGAIQDQAFSRRL